MIAIGTDSPTVDSMVIKEAFLKLGKTRCVIGPSRDGGYYLIGMSNFMRELFEGIDWGTDRVLAQTINVLKRLDISYTLLEESFDVDRYEDLSLLRR